MQDLLNLLFASGNFEPHSAHFLPGHMFLMWSLIIGNAAIAILYFIMPFQLLYIYFKRKDFPFRFTEWRRRSKCVDKVSCGGRRRYDLVVFRK